MFIGPRTTAVALFAAAAAALTVGPAQATPSDFTACPDVSELPAGADPAAWRCEAMTAVGHLDIGRLDLRITHPMAITFAEGTIDGEFHQVFGDMTAAPLAIAGTPFALRPEYAGFSDFQSNDERRGELDLTFALSGPGLRDGCSIGSEADPVHLVLKDTEPTSVVSQDPLVVRFGVIDDEFTAPRSSDCGPLGPVIDRLLGLPAAPGESRISLDAQVALRSYAEL